ncbi:MAG: hypothetical protein ACRDVZ_10450 [Jiangellaceae bacterium]
MMHNPRAGRDHSSRTGRTAHRPPGIGRHGPTRPGPPITHRGGGYSTSADVPAYPDYWNCPLMRIGTQLVRCDNLTGLGAAAPAGIPEYAPNSAWGRR